MKKVIISTMLAIMSNIVSAQTSYQYSQDTVMQTSAGVIYIIRANDAYIHYAKAEPAYERFEPATSSNPAITYNDEGFWNIDYSQFIKPSESDVCNMVKAAFNNYLPILNTYTTHCGQARVVIRTDSQGIFKNADVKIWAEPSIYRQIPPEVLCGLLNALDDLQFGIPAEYQCISDHYFRYSVFFRDL